MTNTSGAFERLRRSPPGDAVTTAGKLALRAAAMATAELRDRPDHLVIGSKRGGTTSLHHYLAEHPGVLPLFPRAQKIKGTYFFDEGWSRGRRWYLSHFPTRATRSLAARRLGYRPVSGESSPYYLYHPLAPERAASLVPGARIVALLRDPVERAFSHYKERRNHTEHLSFADALASEADRCRHEEERIVAEPGYVSFAHRHQSYVDQSRYATPVRRWLEAFGPEAVLVLPSEALYTAPQETFDRICDHIGLPHHRLSDPRAHNAEPSASLDDGLRAELRAQLADDVAALEALLGRSMGWWT